MWKRLQQKPGRQQGTDEHSPSGSPLEEHPYDRPPNTFANVYVPSRADPSRPVRPPRTPPEPKGPPQSHTRYSQAPIPQIVERPASSLYSQPSPKPMKFRLPRGNTVARKYGEEVEISPPSSPEIRPSSTRERGAREASPDISPVDEVMDDAKLHPEPLSLRPARKPVESTIPILRREKRRNQIATVVASLGSKNDEALDVSTRDRKDGDTRWDTLSGEPTTSERGRPPQVTPSSFVPPGNTMYDTAVDNGLGLRTTGSVIPTGQSSFGERVRRIKENSMMIGARPEWKGSSGRSQIVAPVADRPVIRPIEIPRKSSKRANSPRVITAGVSPQVSAAQTGRAETSSVSPTASGQLISPIDLTATSLGASTSPPWSMASSLTSPSSFVSESTIIASQTFEATKLELQPRFQGTATATAIAPKGRSHPVTISDDVPNPPLESKSSLTSIERNFRETVKDIRFPAASSQRPTEVSRFSVTTYATTASDLSSPRMSTDSAPPMPSPPMPHESTLMINRRRPVGDTSSETSQTTARKPIQTSPILTNMSPNVGLNPYSRNTQTYAKSSHSIQPSISKMLPKSPPEAASVDLISSLQAQLDNLAHRRTNLERSIRQMTELMPTDVLARGMEAMRQAEEKRKVEAVRADLADVRREEHDLGLRLHRAYKRRDQNAIYEPTSLWVRRING